MKRVLISSTSHLYWLLGYLFADNVRMCIKSVRLRIIVAVCLLFSIACESNPIEIAATRRAFKSDNAIGRFLPIRPRRWNRERETRMEIELRSSSFGHRSCLARARFDHKVAGLFRTLSPASKKPLNLARTTICLYHSYDGERTRRKIDRTTADVWRNLKNERVKDRRGLRISIFKKKCWVIILKMLISINS